MNVGIKHGEFKPQLASGAGSGSLDKCQDSPPLVEHAMQGRAQSRSMQHISRMTRITGSDSLVRAVSVI